MTIGPVPRHLRIGRARCGASAAGRADSLSSWCAWRYGRTGTHTGWLMGHSFLDFTHVGRNREQPHEAVAMSPEELRKYLASEDATWMPVVRKANIKLEN